jgi:hypothetical protein
MWCAKAGYKERTKPISPDLAAMSRKGVANLLCRFFEWWVKDGRPGDQAARGRLVSSHSSTYRLTCINTCSTQDCIGHAHQCWCCWHQQTMQLYCEYDASTFRIGMTLALMLSIVCRLQLALVGGQLQSRCTQHCRSTWTSAAARRASTAFSFAMPTPMQWPTKLIAAKRWTGSSAQLQQQKTVAGLQHCTPAWERMHS